MVNVYFKHEDDLFYFCERLFRRKSMIDVKWEKTLQQYFKLQMDMEHYTLEEIVHCLTDLFMDQHLHHIYLDIIEHIFFIQDDSSVENILHMMEHISHDDYFLRKVFPHNCTVRHVVENYVQDYVVREENVYFDAMIRFHFSPLRGQCSRLIGFAIDEWRREEEHQLYIEHLRTFIKHRPTMRRRLHVLTKNGQTMFYEEDGTPLHTEKLHALMKDFPLYVVGLDEKEKVISPIITLAPKQILLYAPDKVVGPIQTIIDVFQERVSHLPHSMFPFASE